MFNPYISGPNTIPTTDTCQSNTRIFNNRKLPHLLNRTISKKQPLLGPSFHRPRILQVVREPVPSTPSLTLSDPHAGPESSPHRAGLPVGLGGMVRFRESTNTSTKVALIGYTRSISQTRGSRLRLRCGATAMVAVLEMPISGIY